MNQVFEFTHYKKYFRALIADTNRRGFITELASAMGCSQSYLSQVLRGKPEITPDQASLACDFLEFSTDEAEYFLTLVMHARAVSANLRDRLEAKLTALRKAQSTVEKAISRTSDTRLKVEQRDYYYSSWIIPAVHTLVSCSEYQKPEQIAARLNRPTREIETILGWLVEQGLVTKSQSVYRHSGTNLHLPTESLHNRLNHMNWRMRALESTNDTRAIHYTAAFAISRKDIEKLRKQILTFIESQREQIGRSGSEEAFAFCCDFFEI